MYSGCNVRHRHAVCESSYAVGQNKRPLTLLLLGPQSPIMTADACSFSLRL